MRQRYDAAVYNMSKAEATLQVCVQTRHALLLLLLPPLLLAAAAAGCLLHANLLAREVPKDLFQNDCFIAALRALSAA